MENEPILLYVKRRLKEEGAKQWPEIAEASGKRLPLLRKIAYGDRTNPRLDTIEPIANALRARERAAA